MMDPQKVAVWTDDTEGDILQPTFWLPSQLHHVFLTRPSGGAQCGPGTRLGPAVTVLGEDDLSPGNTS